MYPNFTRKHPHISFIGQKSVYRPTLHRPNAETTKIVFEWYDSVTAYVQWFGYQFGWLVLRKTKLGTASDDRKC